MDVALLTARLLLAAVFLVAGLAKLVDRSGSRSSLVNFGIPSRLAGPLGVLLPVAEVIVAIALIPTSTAWWGAIGTVTLLLLFIAGIGVNMARGKHPDCHCFGQLHSAPAGWATLGRNTALAAIAGFLLWQGRDDSGLSAVAWTGDLSTAEWVGLIAGFVGLALLALGVWVVAHLIGQNGRFLVRLEALEAARALGGEIPAPVAVPEEPTRGLPVGTPAPGFSLPGLYGEKMTLDALRAAGRPVLAVFSNPGCGPCNDLLPDLGRWQREYADRLTIAVLTSDTAEANRAKATEHGITNVLLVKDRAVAEAYRSDGTPDALVIRPDGTIGSPLAPGADAIRALVARTVAPSPPALALLPTPLPHAGVNGNGHGRAHGNGAGTGAVAALPALPQGSEPAPTLSFPDLDGRPLSVAGFPGHPTLVLFWNPGCGFCARMLDDLKAWEAAPPAGAPRLLVISTGTVEANRAMGLRSPVVLDPDFSAGRAFGATGTPSAVLVDAAGRIASPVTVGAPAVLALARGEAPSGVALTGTEAAAPAVPTVGDPAPAVVLPDLRGRTVDLARSRGSRTMVLFWDPGCGFCNRMLDQLRAWDAKPPKGAPKLLVVSTGDVATNRAMGLRSPVVLDQGFTVGPTFGATGTPSAVLVDARGRIASEIAVGADAVLALAGVKPEMVDAATA